MSGLMLFAAAKDLIVYRLKSSGASLYWAVDTLERFVGLNQGRSKEFTKGGQTRGSGGRKSPAGPGAEYGNPGEHQWGRDKN